MQQASSSPTPPTHTCRDDKAPGFKPNFFSKYSVTIDHPISSVFAQIATPTGFDRLAHLSELCTAFQLDEQHHISLPAGSNQSLLTTHVRTLPATSPLPNNESGQLLPRQHFTLVETVPLFFGLLSSRVNLKGTLTWDEPAKVALYESEGSGGILVWKLKTLEDIEDGRRTRVTEEIQGRCPPYLQWIVQKSATRAHIAQMDKYHTLLEE